ncbi:2Fe-2S iron-sulfur cluster binding domain-containing protein [Siminovitchia acidinfaciens]|uniref:2Fe-2S iron-sulfur cluster binding domain-containing protein n=1 Tax=Siminovitchia acidinfaciens TaxID=2321395 RepID=A0A429XZA7_9BACI|nr:2Fe-2S iron-sulfur cluster-binding protein [Siminovitchia acidinfaciens]RST74113.1 2Fe-2S iron-sulfur cluster binding domain-containing protein [Siminovitchia acidinfaciens]
MPTVNFYSEDTLLKSVNVAKGKTILQTATLGRVALRQKCGGKASCLTCKVSIEDQVNISEPSQKEKWKLGEENLAKGVRLSCQTRVYGDVKATIPEDPYKARIRALLEQARKD